MSSRVRKRGKGSCSLANGGHGPVETPPYDELVVLEDLSQGQVVFLLEALEVRVSFASWWETVAWTAPFVSLPSILSMVTVHLDLGEDFVPG